MKKSVCTSSWWCWWSNPWVAKTSSWIWENFGRAGANQTCKNEIISSEEQCKQIPDMVATGVDVFRKGKFSSSRYVSRIHKKVHQKLPTGISLRGVFLSKTSYYYFRETRGWIQSAVSCATDSTTPPTPFYYSTRFWWLKWWREQQKSVWQPDLTHKDAWLFPFKSWWILCAKGERQLIKKEEEEKERERICSPFTPQ